MSIRYEQENDRVIRAMHDDEEVARVVTMPDGTTSFRIEDGSHRGGRVRDVEEAKKRIERYFR